MSASSWDGDRAAAAFSDTRVLCRCHAVSAHDILQQARRGVRDFERLADRTGASTGCGTCVNRTAACFRAAVEFARAEREGQALLPLD